MKDGRAAGIDGLIRAFEKDDMIGVMDQYDSIRGDARMDGRQYQSLADQLRWNQLHWNMDPGKQLIFHTIQKMTDVLADGPIEQRDDRQKLIDRIGEIIEETEDFFRSQPEYREYVGARFFTLDLILDLIFAFSDEIHQIQHSAMLYELMKKWNREGTEGFRAFYGGTAETEIESYAYGNVAAVCRISGEQPYDRLTGIKGQLEKAYAREFCEILCERCGKGKENEPRQAVCAGDCVRYDSAGEPREWDTPDRDSEREEWDETGRNREPEEWDAPGRDSEPAEFTEKKSRPRGKSKKGQRRTRRKIVKIARIAPEILLLILLLALLLSLSLGLNIWSWRRIRLYETQVAALSFEIEDLQTRQAGLQKQLGEWESRYDEWADETEAPTPAGESIITSTETED